MTTRILIPALLVYAAALNMATADANSPVPPQDRHIPAGIPVVESFTGPDRTGKDGMMVRVGFDLALLHQEHRDFIKQGGAAALHHGFRPSQNLLRIKDEKVVIDAVATKDVNALAQELEARGMENISVYGRIVSGRLPIPALEPAAQLKTLQLARPAYARVMTGTVTSQGDAAMLSDDARTAFGVDGTGIKIGTLSDSYNCQGGAAGDVASNDLPSGVQVLADETGCASGSDEGRAMMQIIHDVAPGADQAFYTAFDGTAAFASGITALAAAGADIITDDVIYYAEPMFQDGIIAQAIDTVKAGGVAYFSAAGNQADQSYEDTFRNSGTGGYATGSMRHDFDPGAGTDSLMQVSISGGTQVIFVLQWDDPFYSVSGSPGADTDMDIIIYSSTGLAQAGGIVANIGGDPVEIFVFTTNPGPTKNYQIGVDHVAGPAPGKIKFVYFGNMTINEFDTNSSTSYGHPIAAGGQAVGAARYHHTPDFGISPPTLEYFSSRGGTPILFDTSGNSINDIRQKPDFVAPDGGDNTFFGSDYEGNGYPNFFGTSAAAPHAAALAALLKQFDSTLSPDAIYAAMQTTAIDMGSITGFDYDSGHGLVQATLALQSLDDDGDGVPDSSDNCPGNANATQDNNDNDGQGDACDPDDDNDGLSDTLEGTLGTDPFLVDTDGDGFDDPVEISAGSDPNSNTSIPGVSSGDINGDGSVDVVDVLLATQIMTGDLTPTTNQLLRGDAAPIVNEIPVPDGVINTADLLIIQRKALDPP